MIHVNTCGLISVNNEIINVVLPQSLVISLVFFEFRRAGKKDDNRNERDERLYVLYTNFRDRDSGVGGSLTFRKLSKIF